MVLLFFGDFLVSYSSPSEFSPRDIACEHYFLAPRLEAQEHLCQVGVVVEVVDELFALI